MALRHHGITANYVLNVKISDDGMIRLNIIQEKNVFKGFVSGIDFSIYYFRLQNGDIVIEVIFLYRFKLPIELYYFPISR